MTDTPSIEAATAQPTRQSNQWLSGFDGGSFHSSTFRPRPSVRARYSAVTWSAKSRCSAGLLPNSDRQPLSPAITASRVWMKVFQ